ncbi:MAG: 50S ribosomal protein L5 [uncultured bacterium (gcode 4)]|uniref:Large ribosomal subunit protein uL5 n=1 Tax=uncultured bacterium (gcode 4) TaxID=1234023 RepID=K2FZ52_9BACT|nr:MAG: 50S ribosomal protein L5 [uncultured bacterium (gcode 4)]
MSFKDNYKKNILPQLQKDLGIKNKMDLPKLEKIVLNMGIGTFVRAGWKDHSTLKNDLGLIAGQLPVVKNAKKSISNFKLREGMPVGIMVTLRGDKMFYFLDKFINIIGPRIRDFRWFSMKSFDKEGNYNCGIKEHTIFPEVPQQDVVKPYGLQITLKIKGDNKEHNKALLQAMGFPFTK